MIPNFPIREFMPWTASVFHTGLKEPKDKISEFFESLFSIQDYSLTHTFYSAAVEELFFRLFIQRITLPGVAKLLPKQASRMIDHSITRVMLTSLFFAIAHVSQWDQGVNTQFIGGFIFGASAEMTGGMTIPILAHTIHNLIFSNSDFEIVEPIRFFNFPAGCFD